MDNTFYSVISSLKHYFLTWKVDVLGMKHSILVTEKICILIMKCNFIFIFKIKVITKIK